MPPFGTEKLRGGKTYLVAQRGECQDCAVLQEIGLPRFQFLSVQSRSVGREKIRYIVAVRALFNAGVDPAYCLIRENRVRRPSALSQKDVVRADRKIRAALFLKTEQPGTLRRPL
jgi:hypothetical protein